MVDGHILEAMDVNNQLLIVFNSYQSIITFKLAKLAAENDGC